MIIKEKIALVTGAGSGLGNDFASALLKEKAAAVSNLLRQQYYDYLRILFRWTQLV